MKLIDAQKQVLEQVSSLDELKSAIRLIRDEYLAQHAVIKYGVFKVKHSSHQNVKDVSDKIDRLISIDNSDDLKEVIELYIDLARAKYGVKHVYKYLNLAVKSFITNANIELSRDDEMRHRVYEGGF